MQKEVCCFWLVFNSVSEVFSDGCSTSPSSSIFSLCFTVTPPLGFGGLIYSSFSPPNLSCFSLNLLYPVLPAWVWRTNCSCFTRVKCFSPVPSRSSAGSCLFLAFLVSEVYSLLSSWCVSEHVTSRLKN